jgi:hypothetical protein
VNDRITAGAAALTVMLTGLTSVARRWPVRTRGRHRAVPRTVPLDELLGPPAWYTTPDFADVPVQGVLAQAWRPCSGPCGGEMPSVLHRDGWTCGHCLTTTTTTGDHS